jgi:hypothetical protein
MQTLDAIILTLVHWVGTIAVGFGIVALLAYAASVAAWYVIRESWAYEMTAHVIWHCWHRTRFTRAPKFLRPIRPTDLRKYDADRAAQLEVELDAEGVGSAPDYVSPKHPETAD